MPRLSELKPGERFWWNGNDHMRVACPQREVHAVRLCDGELIRFAIDYYVEACEPPPPIANVDDLKRGDCFLYESEHYVVLSNKKGGVLTFCLERQWKNTFDPGIFVELVKGGLTITPVHADGEG